jgi:hypothetical protein
MAHRFFVFFIITLTILSCSRGKDEGKNGKKSGDKGKSARITRRHIKKLDVKNFIELSLDYTKERRKWNAEWRIFMKKKVKEYFESFGLSEGKFNRFPQRNQREISRFLKKHPRYNQMFQTMMHTQY